MNLQHAGSADGDAINKGYRRKSQQISQHFPTTKIPNRNQPQPTATQTKQKQTKKHPKKTLTLHSLPRKTQNKLQKGLLERHVAVCCALKKDWRPLFRVGSTNLGTCKFEGNPHEKNTSGHK
jgi:hypothetical protein